MVSSVQSTRFEDKVAIVTGGSRGIGAALARRLAGESAAVAIGYRGNKEAADALLTELGARGGRAIAVQADAADPEQILPNGRRHGQRRQCLAAQRRRGPRCSSPTRRA